MPYIPKDSLNLKDGVRTQIRLGLQGEPVSGKTYSICSTVSNLTVLNFDNKLGAHLGKDITVIPFHDPDFVDKIAPRTRGDRSNPPNRRDALLKWLREHANKFEIGQTIFLDSWSLLQDAEDEQQRIEPVYTKKGEIDDFAPWDLKQIYAKDLLSIFKGMKANVVISFHEQRDTDAKNNPTSKFRPLMQGKFVGKLNAYFTDWFRQLAVNKNPDNPLESYPETKYLWMTQPDSNAGCGSSIPNLKKYVPATWDVFEHPEKYTK